MVCSRSCQLTNWPRLTNDIEDSEDRILHWVRCIVEEDCAVIDLDDEEVEFHPDP